MSKWLTSVGCLVVLGAFALVAAFLHAMGLTKYAIWYFQFLFGLASTPNVHPENWLSVDAEVVNISLRRDEHYRDLASIVLRYSDADGRQQFGSFDVFSPGRGLGKISNGDRLEIEVCRGNPTIISSEVFLVSQPRKCVED